MKTYYYGATIYTCNQDEIIEDGVLVVEGNKICEVGNKKDINIPTDADKINAQGNYIIPGLIDCHVHMLMDSVNIETMLMTPRTLAILQGVKNFKKTLRMGFTTVRDCGGCDVGIKKAIEQGCIEGPRLFTCGILTPTGGHNETYFPIGMSLEIEPGNYDTIYDGITGVRIGARKKLRDAYDFLKVTATGGINSPQTDATAPQYTVEELKVVVEESLMRDKKMVVAHCHGGKGLRNALEAGIRSIEHGTWMDDEEVQMMLDKNAYYVPTLYISEYMENRSEIIAPYAREKTKKAGNAHYESFMRAYKAGVKIALGTDAANGQMHGSNARELSLMVKYGMKPIEALMAGTKNAAELLECEDQIGTLEKGKLADFVILNKDPLKDFDILLKDDSFVAVYKDGVKVKRD